MCARVCGLVSLVSGVCGLVSLVSGVCGRVWVVCVCSMYRESEGAWSKVLKARAGAGIGITF